MKSLNRITAIVALLAVALAGGVMWAFASEGEVIYACVNPNSGEIKIVNSPDDCKKTWEPLSWNKQGPEGPPGPEGKQGPPGVCDEAELQALKARIAALEDLLSHFSRDGNDIFVTGANLHVVNGEGHTWSANGVGNVIIGYNEPRVTVGYPNDRSGSHMLVVGSKLNYNRWGGIVAGHRNTTSGAYATVSGGDDNTASGDYATVSGGEDNTASGNRASVSGGYANTASRDDATVSGGAENLAEGHRSTISGGRNRSVSGGWDWRAGNLFEEQ